MKKKIIFFSFATKDLSISADRLRIQTSNTEFYDDIKILSEVDIDKKGKKILSNFRY